jgi:hypothetical protein
VLRDALASPRFAELGLVTLGARLYLGPALALQGVSQAGTQACPGIDEARAVLGEALASSLAAQNPHTTQMARLALARVHLHAGDHAAAAREAEAVVGTVTASMADVMSMSLIRVEAQIVVASVALARGQPEEAFAAASEVMEWIEVRGGVGHQEGRLYLTRAEALLALGEVEAGREALAAARERLLERAANIEDPALRESFLGRVPENARTLALAAAWGAVRAEG